MCILVLLKHFGSSHTQQSVTVSSHLHDIFTLMHLAYKKIAGFLHEPSPYAQKMFMVTQQCVKTTSISG